MATLFESPLRDISAVAELYRGSQRIYYLTNKDIQDFNVSREGQKNKFFGVVISQELTMTLIDKNKSILPQINDRIKVKVSIAGNDSTTTYNPFPSFYITKVERNENTNNITITAIDAIEKTKSIKIKDMDLPQSYNLRQFADYAAKAIGASFYLNGFNSFFQNLSYPEGANFSGEESLREALTAYAEATLSFGYMDSSDRLHFSVLSKSQVAQKHINKDNYFTLSYAGTHVLHKIVSATELGDNVYAETSGTGETQFVRDNPFWELRDDLATVLNNAISLVGGLQIAAFEASWRGDASFDLCEKVSLTTKDNSVVDSFILFDKVHYNGGYKEDTSWDFEQGKDETYANSSTIGDRINQTYAKVDKVNRKIELVVKETETNKQSIIETNNKIDQNQADTNDKIDANQTENDKHFTTITEKMSAIEQDANKINASVSRVEKQVSDNAESTSQEIQTLTNKVNAAITADDVKIEIQKELENGVDKVTTSTGFTFNEEGLKVTKSKSSMETLITEDGMRISRNGEEVLKASNQGVDAENLHATTYLIVGKNSRFEDFGNGRTGCFFIG